ncbi:MAG: phosphate uptake regulator PhoU [Candidatus Bathyarchaeia archaeon]
MEIRKIQFSSGSLFISLPKPWASRHSLKKGSPLFIEEREDGALVLYPVERVRDASKSILIEISPDVEKKITSRYWLGYDSIIVRSPSGRITLTDRERIKSLARRLIGLEIVEESASSIELQCFIEPASVPPIKVLRREYLLTVAMLKDLKDALTEHSLLESIIIRDDEVDKLYFLLVRILRMAIQNPSLSSKLGISPLDCMDYRLVAFFIESIADCIVSISEKLLGEQNFNGIAVENVKAMLEMLANIYVKSMEAFLTKDFRKAEFARIEKEQFNRVISSINLEKMSFLIPEFARICNISIDIADLVIP